jgi:hypothetical protein
VPWLVAIERSETDSAKVVKWIENVLVQKSTKVLLEDARRVVSKAA